MPGDVGNGKGWAVAVDVAKVGWRARELFKDLGSHGAGILPH